jgi:hypothetical protein
MIEPANTPTPSTPATTPVKFRFEKTAAFRSFYVMGGWGRVNGNADIIMSLYQEMEPLPISASYEKQANGNWKIGHPKLEFTPDVGGVRQIEAEIILPIDGAKRLVENLNHFIKLAEQLKANRELAAKKQGEQPTKMV